MTTDKWISPEGAWLRLAEHCSPLGPEKVDRRSTLGQVLAESLAATVDIPPADVSAMDGFAVSEEVAAGDRLPICGIIPAGSSPDCEIERGCAMRIMTGAPIPRGADRVVPVEQTTSTKDEVLFRSGTEAGSHIRRQAEIQRRGDPLLPAGSMLTAGGLSLLATHGIASVPVSPQTPGGIPGNRRRGGAAGHRTPPRAVEGFPYRFPAGCMPLTRARARAARHRSRSSGGAAGEDRGGTGG